MLEDSPPRLTLPTFDRLSVRVKAWLYESVIVFVETLVWLLVELALALCPIGHQIVAERTNRITRVSEVPMKELLSSSLIWSAAQMKVKGDIGSPATSLN